ncbi:MAG TPA: chemotaxis protein CheB [Pseudomonadota bacterium]|nr:chemotaxis protein CheB [Pseudomonadota bacterium]
MTIVGAKDSPPLGSPCRVLLVDDSASFRLLLGQLLGRTRGITVVGEAADGEAALRLCEELHPDVVVMDVMMPKLDGLAAARILMHRSTGAVVLLSVMMRYKEHRAMLAGLPPERVTVLDKPVLVGEGAPAAVAQLASQLVAAKSRNEDARKVPLQRPRTCELVVIASSTGGLDALRILLAQVTPRVPPLVIAQHLPLELGTRFAATLGQGLAVPLHAVDGTKELVPGHVYIAARHSHLEVERGIVRSRRAESDRLASSADSLFFSAAAAYGAAALGIVLTGMGRDGALGLLALRAAGGWTVTQSGAVVDGMPRAAQESGGSCESLALAAIGELLAQLRHPSVAAPEGPEHASEHAPEHAPEPSQEENR